MWRFLVRWIAPLVLAAACCPSAVLADQASDTSVSRGVKDVGSSEDTGNHSPPALPYAVAGFSTLLIMVIICMPSRKADGSVTRR